MVQVLDRAAVARRLEAIDHRALEVEFFDRALQFVGGGRRIVKRKGREGGESLGIFFPTRASSSFACRARPGDRRASGSACIPSAVSDRIAISIPHLSISGSRISSMSANLLSIRLIPPKPLTDLAVYSRNDADAQCSSIAILPVIIRTLLCVSILPQTNPVCHAQITSVVRLSRLLVHWDR